MAKWSREELIAKIKELDDRAAAAREDQKLADELETKATETEKILRQRNAKLEGTVRRVKRVIDGDTVEDTEGNKFRPYGADAPELSPTKKLYSTALRTGKQPEEIQAAGMRSKANLESLIGQAFTVSNVRSDVFGRALAYMTNEKGQDIGLEQIRSGHAEPTRMYQHPRLVQYMMNWAGVPGVEEIKKSKDEVALQVQKSKQEITSSTTSLQQLSKTLFDFPQAQAADQKIPAKTETRQLGVLDRIFTIASSGSVMNAAYPFLMKTRKEKGGDVSIGDVTGFLGDIATDFASRWKEGITGRAEGPVRKTGSDILRDVYGWKYTKGKLEPVDLAGVGLDLGGDVSTWGTGPARWLSEAGQWTFKQAKNIPGVSRVTGAVSDFMGPLFNRFYDIEKHLTGSAFEASRGNFPNAPLSEWFKSELTKAISEGGGAISQFQRKFGELLDQGKLTEKVQNLNPNFMQLQTGTGGVARMVPAQTVEVQTPEVVKAVRDFVQTRFWEPFKGDSSTFGGRALNTYLDVQDKFKTAVTSFWPQFHERNFMDAIMKNFQSGVGASDYWQGWKALWGKGGPIAGHDVSTVNWMAEKFGVTGNKGMISEIMNLKSDTKIDKFFEAARNIGGYITTGIENAVRMPMFVNQLKRNVYEGISEGEKKGMGWISAQNVQRAHYMYNPAFQSDFVKGGTTLIPFGNWLYQNMKFWGGELLQGKTEQLSKIDKFRDQPTEEKKPGYLENIMTFGRGYGGIGSGIEDFASNFQDFTRALSTKVNPLLEKSAEWLSNWNAFKGQTIESDTIAGKKYQQAPGIIQSLVGFTPPNAVDANMRWLVEAFGSRPWSALTSPFGKDQPYWQSAAEGLLPVKQYPTGPDATKFSKDMEARRDSMEYTGTVATVIKNIMKLFEIESAKAAGGEGPNMRFPWAVDPKIKKAYEGQMGEGTYGIKPTPWGATAGETRARENMSIDLLEKYYKAGGPTMGSSNLFERSFFKNVSAPQMIFGMRAEQAGWDKEAIKLFQDQYAKEGDLTRIRTYKEGPPVAWKDIAGKIPGMGTMDESAYLAKQLQNITSFMSKTEEIYRSGQPLTRRRIEEEMQASLRGAQLVQKTTPLPPEAYQDRVNAIYQRAEEQLEKHSMQVETVIAESMKDYAEGMATSEEKIYALRDANVKKWEASEEARRIKRSIEYASSAEEQAQYEQIYAARIAGFYAKADGDIKEHRVKIAREIAEAEDAMARDRIRAAVATAELQMRKGEIVLKEFLAKELEAINENFKKNLAAAKAAVEEARKSAVERGVKPEQYEPYIQAKKKEEQINKDWQTQSSAQQVRGMTLMNQLDIKRAEIQKMVGGSYQPFGTPLPETRERQWGAIEEQFNADTSARQNKIQQTLSEAGADPTEIELRKAEDADNRHKELMDKRAAYHRETLKMMGQSYGDFFGDAAKMFESFYEASGKKSKEFFFLMKSMQVAQAIVQGISAVISAYEKGTTLGGPILGAAWAAIAAAFTGAQVGMLAAQMFEKGGEVKGPAGRDAVPARLTAGEFVMTTGAVQQYGMDFMHSVNKGLFPKIAMAEMPSPKTHFATGGLVMPQGGENEVAPTEDRLQIINVVDPSTMDRYLSASPGQKTLLNVISHNKYEIRQILGS